MAVGSSFLSFTNAIAYPGREISHARAISATQLAPNALLRRSSFRAGLLWEPCPRGQLEGRACKERKLRAALSQSVDAYRRVGAPNLENVDIPKLVQALEEASAKGREVIMAAVDKPRNIDYKGATDLVTEYGDATFPYWHNPL